MTLTEVEVVTKHIKEVMSDAIVTVVGLYAGFIHKGRRMPSKLQVQAHFHVFKEGKNFKL